MTYDGGDGKLVLLGILEQVQHIVADDDTLLPGEDIFGTHIDNGASGAVGVEMRGGRDRKTACGGSSGIDKSKKQIYYS